MNSEVKRECLGGEHFFDVLDYYKDVPEIYTEIKQFIENNKVYINSEGYDLKLYNQLIDWLEKNLGEANAKSAGRRMFKKFFEKYMADEFEIRSVEFLSKISSKLNEILQDEAVMLEIENSDDFLIIKVQSKFNKSFQAGFIEEFLGKLNNVYFIKESSVLDDNNDCKLILVYKTILI